MKTAYESIVVQQYTPFNRKTTVLVFPPATSSHPHAKKASSHNHTQYNKKNKAQHAIQRFKTNDCMHTILNTVCAGSHYGVFVYNVR